MRTTFDGRKAGEVAKNQLFCKENYSKMLIFHTARSLALTAGLFFCLRGEFKKIGFFEKGLYIRLKI